MEERKTVDFYRIAFYCGVLVVAWLIQVAALRQFVRYSLWKQPPQYLVVDFNQTRLFPDQDLHQLLNPISEESSLKTGTLLVTKDQGEKFQREYQIKKWSPLAVAIAGALIAAGFAWLLSGSWWIVMGAIVFAPLTLHFMHQREWRRER